MVLSPAHWFGRGLHVAVPILSAPWRPLRLLPKWLAQLVIDSSGSHIGHDVARFTSIRDWRGFLSGPEFIAYLVVGAEVKEKDRHYYLDGGRRIRWILGCKSLIGEDLR